MAAIQQLVGEIRVDSSGVNKGVNEAQSGLDKLGSKAQQVGGRMQSTGKAMTVGLSAPLVAMGATAVSQAATFESAMQSSISIMGDVSAAERNDLEKTAREVAKSTTMSHEQAASSYYYLASAGMDAAESMEAMPKVAEYAESANLDMATATDYATDIMSAFGYEAQEMTQVTDVLTQAVSNHNTTAEGMGEAMSYVAPVAKSLGISIEETAAAIGMFSDVGIKGSKAGTSLRGVLASLADPTSKQASLLKELGVNTQDAQGNMLPLVDIVEQLEESGADTADVMALFGREAGPAMAALLEEGSGALRENTTALEEAEGATKAVAETQRDTLMGSISILKSNLADLAIQFGSEMTPAIRAAADALSGISKVFGTIPSPMRKVIIAAAAIVAAIGPLLFIFGTLLTMVPSMIAGWGTLTTAFGAVSAVLSGGLIPALGAAATTLGSVLAPAIAVLLGPIGLAIGAIALLAAAWATDFGGIRKQTMRVVSVLQEEFGPAIEWLRSTATKIMEAFGFSGSGAFSTLSQAAVPLIEILANGLIAIIRVLGFVGRMVFTGLATVFSVFHTVATTAINGVRAVLAPMLNWMSKFWSAHGAVIRQEAILTWNVVSAQFAAGAARVRAIVGQLVTFVRPIYVAMMTTLRTITNTVLAGLNAFWSAWGSDIMSVVGLLKNTVVTIVQQLMHGISTLIRVGLAVLRGDWVSAWNLMATYVNRTTTQIEGLVNRWASVLSGIVKKLVGKIIGFFQTLYQRLVGGSIVPNMVNAIVRAFTNLGDRVVAAVTNLQNRAIRAFNNLKNRAVSATNTLRSQVVQKFVALKNRAQSVVSAMMNTLPRIIRRAAGAFKSAGASLITAFARGVSSKIGRVKSSVKNAVSAARRYLPGSDAEEGPLSDLSETGPALVETFARGIEANTHRAASAAESVAMAAKRPLESLTPKGDLHTLMDRVNEVMMDVKVEGRDSVGGHQVNRLQEFAAMFGRDFGRNADKLVDFAEKVADWRVGGGAPDINPGYTPVDPANYERKAPAVGGDIADTINDILGRGSYTPKELKTLDRIAQSMGEDFRLDNDDFRDPAYYVGNELGKMGKLIDWANRQTSQEYGGRYDDIIKKNAEKMGGSAKKAASVFDDIVKRRGEFDGAAAIDAITELAMGERRELGSQLADQGYFKKNYEAMRQMRNAIAGGEMSQQLYDALTRSGITRELKRLVDTGLSSRDPQEMVQHEDGSWAETSLWTDRGQKPPEGAEMRRMNDRGEWVSAATDSMQDIQNTLQKLHSAEVGQLGENLALEKWTGPLNKEYIKLREEMQEALAAFRDGDFDQALYDALTSGSGKAELGKILRDSAEAKESGKVLAEDGTWVDPSFYNRTSQPMSAGGDENPDEVGRMVAHAVQETLAGSELDLDTNGDDLVEKATLKVKEERKRNVRKSARTTR